MTGPGFFASVVRDSRPRDAGLGNMRTIDSAADVAPALDVSSVDTAAPASPSVADAGTAATSVQPRESVSVTATEALPVPAKRSRAADSSAPSAPAIQNPREAVPEASGRARRLTMETAAPAFDEPQPARRTVPATVKIPLEQRAGELSGFAVQADSKPHESNADSAIVSQPLSSGPTPMSEIPETLSETVRPLSQSSLSPHTRLDDAAGLEVLLPQVPARIAADALAAPADAERRPRSPAFQPDQGPRVHIGVVEVVVAAPMPKQPAAAQPQSFESPRYLRSL